MRRTWATTVVFGLALVALVALAVWWTVFLSRSVESERQAQRAALFHRAEMAALRLGHRLDGGCDAVRPGAVAGSAGLEVVDGCDGEGCRSLEPDRCDLAVRPTAASLAAIEARVEGRRFMVMGEGALLFLLLAVCVVMLYRLTAQEMRYIQRMERFVSAFTHEIKTPLAGIKSLLQTLAADRVPEARRREVVELGVRQAERLQHSIENVLLSGSLRAGRYEIELGDVALRELVTGLIEQHDVGLADRVELRWRLESAELLVPADREALRIVLDNLIDNAMKYGGDAPVAVGVSRTAEWVEIRIEDSGRGFTAQELERLFLPFERGNTGAGEAGEAPPGTGLGLYIARSLARRMGGDVQGESPGPGQGSSFTLTLDLDDGKEVGDQ